MNLVWIAALALVVLGEKIVPGSRILPRGLGAVAIAGGIGFLLV
jgi:predicted metal-binding membrane protein